MILDPIRSINKKKGFNFVPFDRGICIPSSPGSRQKGLYKMTSHL